MAIGIWLWLLSVAHACGVAIHLELVDRILPSLPPRLARHYNYIRSGAFYPDAFYNCMGQYDVAEDAHWPPFLANGIRLVHERRARGEDTAQFEAFLLGILTHQVSDVSWHSLGIFQGLLRAMAEEEFHGDYEKAHSVLDIGGDMIHLKRHTIRKERSTKWDFNLHDILDLLEVNGYTNVSTTSIRYCMARGHAAYSAELRVAGLGYKRFARQSPLLFDEMESYFSGGLTDMHEQIEECVPNLFDWFNNGVSGNPWGICQVFTGSQYEHNHPFAASNDEDLDPPHRDPPHRDPPHHDPPHRHDAAQRHDPPHHHGSDEVLETIDKHIDVSRRSPSIVSSHNVGRVLELLRDILMTGKEKALLSCEPQFIPCSYMQPPAHTSHGHTGMSLLPSYGQSLIFWNSSLVVGAPNEGRVYIYGNTSLATFDHLHTAVSSDHKPKRKGRYATKFGHSLAVWKDYLVVASPGVNELDLYDATGRWSGGIQWANTTTLYGARGTKLVGKTLAVDSTTNAMYVGAPYSDVVNDRIHVDEVVANSSKDLNDGVDRRFDQIGMVLKLPADILEDAVRAKQYEVLDPEHYLLYRGQKHYEHAGMSLTVTPKAVLVGSPGESIVQGFHPVSGKHLFNLNGTALDLQKPSGFGAHLLTGNSDVTIVGAPSGSVPSKFDVAPPSQEGVLTIYKSGQPIHIGGGSDFQWFGSNGVVVGSKVYVVSPHASEGKGQLWQVDLDKAKPRTVGSIQNSFASGFGSSIASNGEVLAIGMPNYGVETGQTRRGAVAIIRIP